MAVVREKIKLNSHYTLCDAQFDFTHTWINIYHSTTSIVYGNLTSLPLIKRSGELLLLWQYGTLVAAKKFKDAISNKTFTVNAWVVQNLSRKTCTENFSPLLRHNMQHLSLSRLFLEGAAPTAGCWGGRGAGGETLWAGGGPVLGFIDTLACWSNSCWSCSANWWLKKDNNIVLLYYREPHIKPKLKILWKHVKQKAKQAAYARFLRGGGVVETVSLLKCSTNISSYLRRPNLLYATSTVVTNYRVATTVVKWTPKFQ